MLFRLIGVSLLGFSSFACSASATDPTPTPNVGNPAARAAKRDGTSASSSDATGETPNAAATADTSAANPASSAGAPTTPPAAEVSPKPAAACSISKDGNGFFTRTSAKSDYVAYVPASYTGDGPAPLVVGLHGCGDNAMNFATWGVNPWDTRSAQKHIGISIDGATGSGSCWNKGGDDDKVMAAIDDIASCFWVDRSRIVLAGFSSGGELAYRVGLMNASKFAGILIENSNIYSAGVGSSELLGGAAWKLPIAHRAHSSDSVFPLSSVQDSWSEIEGAGFPLETSVVSGGHDGSGADWSSWLLPHASDWVKPSL